MTRYSVLVPLRNQAEAFARQLPKLELVLESLRGKYEILALDDASSLDDARVMERLADDYGALRWLRMSSPSGSSAVLSAGLKAAKGEILIAITADNSAHIDDIPAMVSRLARADAVFGKRGGPAWTRFLRGAARLPRRVLLGREVHDPTLLLWAARREAVAELELGRGEARFLASLVAMRGFRLDEITVAPGPANSSASDGWSNPGDLLSMWWRCRRSVNAHWQEVRSSHRSTELRTTLAGPLRDIDQVRELLDDQWAAEMRKSA